VNTPAPTSAGRHNNARLRNSTNRPTPQPPMPYSSKTATAAPAAIVSLTERICS
jgi:hypothetical protein